MRVAGTPKGVIYVTPFSLEIVPVDSKINEHLVEQTLADFLLSILDGGPTIARVERSM